MPTREEMISFLNAKTQPTEPQQPSREDMISFLQKKGADPSATAAPVDNRSTLDTIRDGLDIRNMPGNFVAGLKKIDEYTGAPIRKFVTEKVTGKEMDHAPSGAEQAKMLGATDKTYKEVYGVPTWLGGNISPADIYGVGLDMAQDPATLLTGAGKGIKAVAGAIPAVAESTIAKTAAKAFQSQAAGAAAEIGSRARSTIEGGGVEVEQGGKLFSVQAPKSLEELRAWKPEGNPGELPGKGRLEQIEKSVPDLQTKPLKYHYDMMENPKSMKALKLEFENLPTKDAQKIAAYNQQIVHESGAKVKETVGSISPNSSRSLTEAGDDLVSTVKDKYNAEKSALGPVFQQLQKTPRSSRAETMDLAQAIAANTKLGKVMEVGEDGKLFLAKNTPRTGISDAEHSILGKVVADMNDGMTFKEMQDTRAYLRKAVDPMNPHATEEVNKVRSILLDHMESKASAHGPGVADTFKAYAKNERARENVEKVIGGKIESLDSMYAANPDRIVKKIFANPNYAKTVGEYVGEEKMKDLIGSYVNDGVSKAYDSAKGFDPSKLRTWMKSNDQFLTRYLDPSVKDRLGALADYGFYGKRFLDEVNPSGTAASLLHGAKSEPFLQKISTKGVIGTLEHETFGKVNAITKQRQAVKTLNEALGVAPATKASIGERVVNAANTAEKSEQGISTQFGAAGVRNLTQATKGPEKWANDGIDNIMNSDQSDIDRATLEKLKASKSGQKLLIEASTAKNKKAMENVLNKIRSSSSSKGDE